MENDCKREEASPPWNFSWVVKNQLAAMAWPYSEPNLRFLLSQGIKHLITLSPEKRPPVQSFPDISWTEIPVEEFEAPALYQILKFIEICEECLSKNEAIGIHCRQGRGRTGVMAACFLVRFQDLAPERAIINLRLQRPGSIETLEQERSVAQYHDYLRKRDKFPDVKNVYKKKRDDLYDAERLRSVLSETVQRVMHFFIRKTVKKR